MIENEWGLSFGKCLARIIDGMKKIELQRQILGSVKEFEPYACFMRLDRGKKKYLTINDFRLFLRDMNVIFSDRILRDTIKYYDKDRDSCLNYEEFLKLVLTSCDNELRADITQRRNYSVNNKDCLIIDIEENLALLILKEMELAEEINYKANSIINYNGKIDYSKIFRTIDYLNYNYLDRQTLGVFLKNYGFFVTDSDIEILISRLDIDCKGVVSYENFLEVFSPQLMNSISTKDTNNISNNDYNYNNNINNLYPKQIEEIYVRSPLRGSVGLRASFQSYTSPVRKVNNIDNIKPTFLDKELKDKLRNSHISERSLYCSTRFSDLSLREHGYPIYTSKIDYVAIITNFFIKLISLENQLQTAKETFCLREFNLKRLFNIFDPYYKGYATVSDFKKGLQTLNIYTSKEDLIMLFKRYDINKDGFISFSEFTAMITPLNNEYARLLSNRITNTHSQNERPTEEFSKLIKLLIQTEFHIETLRKLSTNNAYFISSDAFDVIKGEYGYIKNYIIKEDIDSFLKLQGIITTDFQLDCIFDRFDKNRDCRITIDEFCDEILPINYK